MAAISGRLEPSRLVFILEILNYIEMFISSLACYLNKMPEKDIVWPKQGPVEIHKLTKLHAPEKRERSLEEAFWAFFFYSNMSNPSYKEKLYIQLLMEICLNPLF